MKKGFTLIELLIVIAILAALATAVVLILNPAELLRQARDSTRLSDMAAMDNAVLLWITDVQNCSGSGCWPTSATATQTAAASTTPFVTITATSSPSTSAAVNGTGWIPVDFTKIFSGSPLGKLPIDPVNGPCTSNGTSVTCVYTFVATSTGGGQFEIDTRLEATRNASTSVNDGGTQSAWYEIGNNLKL